MVVSIRRSKITRFQVMATLQAARAMCLGLDLDEAKSWGLNRALFYAAAKRGWGNARALGARQAVIGELEISREKHDPTYVLGGEKAFRIRDLSDGLRFKFGNEIQRPEDFDRLILRRFPDWENAWEEAQNIVRSAPRRDLDIQGRFFKHIYEPRRDELAERWSAMRRLSRAS